ncbi:related to O-methylsterigmatocystin oxidoreductase [Cephalotrichum gorgonifer]|uniref:Related to O-methylsterigmatocystin oxidoreductase n=1 Tax=Cephalotrichum gorgonifer TaxID=2041049 RepID=A0AAE8MYH2_9PEZI|nr:related to O-methylsterigmatocystin oxidoreductase [Cephalotrichum gorgonifer]
MSPAPSWQATSVVGLAVALITLLIKYLPSTTRPKDFPPGPPTVPGIGNLHQIPLKQPFLKFTEWSKTYGDIIGLKAGSANLVILGSPLYVHELLDKRGTIYSGRPYSHITSEHILRGQGDIQILNVQNGPYLRRWRSSVSTIFGPSGVKKIIPMQEMTAASLVHKLLVTPSESPRHLKSWALATPLLAITGERLEDRGEDYMNRFFRAQEMWLQVLDPGSAPLVDILPALKWVPERWAHWKTKVRYIRDYILEEYDHYFQTANGLRITSVDDQRSEISGSARFPFLMTKAMDDQAQAKEGTKSFTDKEISFMGGDLLGAAVDTTWAAIMSFVMFIGTYPEIQAKAQEEVDRVSPDKPPGGEDINRLPYIRACIMEVLRLRPPTPSAIPHVLDRDDTFQGYRIPKGTTVIPNVWGIQHNPEDYYEPEMFIPERYILHPMGLKPGVDATEGRRETYTFGAGRRICPGEQFARNSLLLAAAKLLWAFNIVPPEPLDLSIETGFQAGLVIGPKSFKTDFTIRHEGRAEGIVEDFKTRSADMEL